VEAHQPPYSARAVASLNLQTDAGPATVRQVCLLFCLSRAAYYNARNDKPTPTRQRGGSASSGNQAVPLRPRPAVASAEQLRAAISAVAAAHPAWGVRKIWATLRRPPYGLRAGTRRIWVLMRELGLTFAPDHPGRDQLRHGHVAVEQPNRRWATDLTTVWTRQDGLVAVVPVVDCGDRTLLAIQATKQQDSPTVLAPVREALEASFQSPDNVPSDLELRTDHGSQYTGGDCEQLCREWRLEHTLAPVGRPTGNAVAERFIRTLKEELIWLRDWDSLSELQAALAAYRAQYNTGRPHQALAWQTPAERRAERLAA